MPTVQASTPCKSRRIAAAPQAPRRIPLSVPCLAGNEWVYLKECVDSGWVSSAGPFVKRFERVFAEAVGVTHAVAVVNGTAGLHLALRAALVREHDEVLVPTLTFIAPVNAIRYCGAHPVFIDADPQTWQMDVAKLERFLREQCVVERTLGGTGAPECRRRDTGRRVRAVLPVHILGMACDMDRIIELAREFCLQVVGDACEAIGVVYRGRSAGWWGDVSVFSFNGNKTVTCGGGGMVVLSNRPQSAGFIHYLATQAKDDAGEHSHREIGYNYRMTNLQAAVGLAQLEQLPSFLGRKRAIAKAYAEQLCDVSGLTLMPEPTSAYTQWAYWLYTILLPEGTTIAGRQAFIKQLARRGIEARPLWQPVHTQPPYQAYQPVDVQVAFDLYARAVSLPSSVGLSETDQQRCIRAVRELVGR